MYENLEQIATLKFGKEMESISSQTRERVKEMQNENNSDKPASAQTPESQPQITSGLDGTPTNSPESERRSA